MTLFTVFAFVTILVASARVLKIATLLFDVRVRERTGVNRFRKKGVTSGRELLVPNIVREISFERTPKSSPVTVSEKNFAS